MTGVPLGQGYGGHEHGRIVIGQEGTHLPQTHPLRALRRCRLVVVRRQEKRQSGRAVRRAAEQDLHPRQVGIERRHQRELTVTHRCAPVMDEYNPGCGIPPRSLQPRGVPPAFSGAVQVTARQRQSSEQAAVGHCQRPQVAARSAHRYAAASAPLMRNSTSAFSLGA